MKFKAHANLCAAAVGGAYALSASAGSVLQTVISSSAASQVYLDIPSVLGASLLGCSLVDMDLLWSGPGHRVNSFAHKFEAPVFIGAFFAVLAETSSRWFLDGPSEIVSTVSAFLALLCLGWWLHLVGDFIEGGVGSLFVRGKIGFTWFKWTRYDGTFLGYLIDWSLGILAIASISFLVFSFSPERFSLIPAFLSEISGTRVPDGSGVLIVPVLWAFFMSWGRGGAFAFFSRLVLLCGCVLAAFLSVRYLDV